MAKIQEITLKKSINYAGLADEALKLLRQDEPPQLSDDDVEALVSSFTPKSDAKVSIHTRLTYGQALEKQLAETKAKREHEKARAASLKRNKDIGEFDIGWFLVQFFCTGWSDVLDPDTGEQLPFSQEGMQRADVHEIAAIIELATRVATGQDPNA